MFKEMFPFSLSETSGQSSNLSGFNFLKEASVSQKKALTKLKEEGKANFDYLILGF